ncbi:MAG: 50S ribosomal protein L10 [Oscillospiraceae bacterium]
MPSDKILSQKQEMVEELTVKLQNAVSGVLVDYKGINVDNDTKMRRELRAAGVEYAVIKNSLLRRACEKAGYDELKDVLTGTTALAISNEDAIAPAKILAKYAKDSKDFFNLKAGFVEGRAMDAAAVDELSKLPSKEELVAKMLGSLNSPISGLVNVLNGNIRGLVIALNQIAEKSA